MIRTVLLIICFLSCKHSFTQSEYYFTRGLAASGIHHYGREALYTDKLAYQLYTNTLKKPVEGEALGINNNKGEAVYWQLITADSANRFRGRGFGGGGGYIYFTYDPSVQGFPSCPSKKYLGIACPGCGSQRAAHHLLHGEFRQAFLFNPMLLVAIPYMILASLFEIRSIRTKYPKFRKWMFGRNAILVVLVIVIVYWITRNVFRF